ncbi:MAG: ribosome maturation factor RimP [candidate division KSB1 bacterium]|nr:ribosome maturation factor RimP [candidate division KSB1 bacterium]
MRVSAEEIRQLIEPLLEREGVELVDLELKGAPGRFILRVFIDEEGGITIDRCTEISRKLSDFLDRKDPIPGRYVLEVSSPGVDRPLLQPRDFRRNVGREVRVEYRQGDETLSVTGRIVAASEVLELEVAGERLQLQWEDVLRGKVQVHF